MAADILSQQIIRHLQSRVGQSDDSHSISATVNATRKTVNAELYRLSREGVVYKLQDSPPIWAIRDGQSGRGSFSHSDTFRQNRAGVQSRGRGHRGIGYGRAPRRGRGRGSIRASPSHKLKKTPINNQIVRQVVNHMLSCGHPLKSLDVARAVGLTTSSEVNHILYLLQRRHLIQQSNGRPPKWFIQDNNSPAIREVLGGLREDNTTYASSSNISPFQESDRFRDRSPLSNNRYTEDGEYAMETNTSAESYPSRSSSQPSADTKTFQSILGLRLGDTPEDAEFEDSPSQETSESGEEEIPPHPFMADNRQPPQLFNQLVNETKVKVEQCLPDFSESFPAHTCGMDPEYVQHQVQGLQSVSSNMSPVMPSLSPQFKQAEEDINRMCAIPGTPDSATVACKSDMSHTSDLTEVDQILKELALCPFSQGTSFVLSVKTKISKNRVEELLKELQRKKYVKLQMPVWVLCPAGEEYIKSKSHMADVTVGLETPVSPPPLRKKTVHSGPPPPPKALLEMEGESVSQNSSRREIQTGDNNFINSNSGFCYQTSQSRPPGAYRQERVSSYSSASESSTCSTSMSLPYIHSQPNAPVSLMSLNVQARSPMDNLLKATAKAQSPTSDIGSSRHSLPGTELNAIKGSSLNNRGEKTFKPPAPPIDLVTSLHISPRSQNALQATCSRLTTPGVGGTVRTMPLSDFQRKFGVNQGEAQTSSLSDTFSDTNSFPYGAHNRPSSQQSRSEQYSNPSLFNWEPQSLPAMPSQPVTGTGVRLEISLESFAPINKNPVSALMEYAQSRKKEARVEVLSQRGSSHKPTFQMAAFVDSRQFPSVTCHNKKDGKKEACDVALRQLQAEGLFQNDPETKSTKTSMAPNSLTHFDTMAALTHQGFTAIVSQIKSDSLAGRKVIAGLIMKRYPEDVGLLISLGTGNRCITGPQLSLEGNTVNDSHAEIITRRGFLRFLYKQLIEYDPEKNVVLFEKGSSGKLRIKQGVSFHLYISTAPCGDGAIFSPRDAAASNVQPTTSREHTPTFTSSVQGVLRTKVEGGEGTIPIEAGFQGQTYDGIMRGERLRTMSCSDKICRWNVLGLQGALLSLFLEPIYLESLTLGLLFDPGHLSRAVCCRVAHGDPNIMLPGQHQLNHPRLGRVTACDPPREVQKTKALSINWIFGDEKPEVTDGTLGLCNTGVEKTFFSRCTKRNLYDSFKEVCKKFGRHDYLQVGSYKEAKMKATDFQQAREVMLRRFHDNKFGTWVSKPVEEEMFS